MSPQPALDLSSGEVDWAERLFWAALALYVVVLPLGGTTALRSIAFAMLVGATLWQAIRRRLVLRFPLAPWWIVYAGVALASLTYALNPRYSAGEIKAEIVYQAIIVVISASWIRDAARFSRLLWLVLTGNLIFVAGSAWNLAEHGHDFVGAWNTGVGATATVVATVLPWVAMRTIQAAQARQWRMAFALLILCLGNLGSLALALNRQGWIALFVSFLVAIALAPRGYWTRRRIFAALALIGVLLAVNVHQFRARIGIPNLSTEASIRIVETDLRWPLWRFSLERIADRPWSGGGFGREAFELEFRDYRPDISVIWHAHNMILNKGIQMGIPGIASFLLLWAAAAAACVRALREPALRAGAVTALAMLAGIFVRNMADDFFVRDLALMFWLLLGGFLGGVSGTAGRTEAADVPL